MKEREIPKTSARILLDKNPTSATLHTMRHVKRALLFRRQHSILSSALLVDFWYYPNMISSENSPQVWCRKQPNKSIWIPLQGLYNTDWIQQHGGIYYIQHRSPARRQYATFYYISLPWHNEIRHPTCWILMLPHRKIKIHAQPIFSGSFFIEDIFRSKTRFYVS